MANFHSFDYWHREPRRYDYDDGRDYSREPWSNQGYQNDPNPGWSDYRSHGFENTDRYDWRDGNREDYIHYEEREPPSWQYQQQFSMPHNGNFRGDYAASFNYGGDQYYDDWDDFSPYQDPSPPPQQHDDKMWVILQQMEQINLQLQAREEEILALKQSREEEQARLKRLNSQIIQLTAETTSPYIPSPAIEPLPFEEFDCEKEEFEGEEGSEVASEQEHGEEKEMEIERESEKAPHPNIKPPPPYPREITAEDAALIQLLKDYVASCSHEELWGKGEHEKEKESEQEYVPEIEEALLNTPLEVVEVPLEIMSEPTNRDPSEVSRYGRQQQDLREDHTKQPGKELKVKRKTSKLLLFPSYFKSRWRDTFDGLRTISGLELGICAKRCLPLQGKRDLRPP